MSIALISSLNELDELLKVQLPVPIVDGLNHLVHVPGADHPPTADVQVTHHVSENVENRRKLN